MAASSCKIRKAAATQCAEILGLWRMVGSGPTVTDTAAHLKMLAAESDLFLVALIEGRVVGTILGGWDQWRGHIYRLAVHPIYRRSGIARRLLAEILKRLWKKGARRIYAMTNTEDGLKFWKSTDFRRARNFIFVKTMTRVK